MARLRVCLVASHFAEYGFALASALREHAEVMVLATQQNVASEMGADFIAAGCDGHHVHFLHKTRNPLRVPLEAAGIVRAVRSFHPHVLHFQEDSKDALALALPFLGDVPMLLTMHDPLPHGGNDTRVRQRSRHGRYIEQLRRRADAVLVHGQLLVGDARLVLAGRNCPVYVQPHGPLGERWMGGLALSQEPGRCLFFGRIEAYKGLRHFIALVQQLNQQGLAVRGVVAGRGTDLAPYRASLRTDPAFELIEKFLEPREVAEQFLRADVVVMPYENATQSGVAALALGAGRPVVAFDVGALQEMVQHETTGLLVPAGDMQAMRAALSRLIHDRALNRHIGEQARRRAESEFSWRSIAAGTASIYESLVNGR